MPVIILQMWLPSLEEGWSMKNFIYRCLGKLGFGDSGYLDI
jgi:hypothetical protein